ncbi:uncharacterized protein C8R40DRAFT_874507 [Lentinula edodes]|uniref:uncharacterized protein n=1 Tax=Lentinula edodes TaxID=5353 RepID=UPI001E8E6326|nr:uncharacterized protein C8R40DRAFT_874507 [Lentinula edodes]KAH7877902.1 hypothetical protein C8R40DRAFT_874507 [Lentinula edodes]
MNNYSVASRIITILDGKFPRSGVTLEQTWSHCQVATPRPAFVPEMHPNRNPSINFVLFPRLRIVTHPSTYMGQKISDIPFDLL